MTLQCLKPRIKVQGARLPTMAPGSWRTDKQTSGQRGYDYRWQKRRGTRYSNAPELDHRVPISKGGTHLYTNVQCACRDCNGKKSNRSTVGQLPMFAL